jgi:hypothetical protein
MRIQEAITQARTTQQPSPNNFNAITREMWQPTCGFALIPTNDSDPPVDEGGDHYPLSVADLVADDWQVMAEVPD